MSRPKASFKAPTYRLHRASGQAVASLSGREFYLGKHGTPESREKFAQLVKAYREGKPLAARAKPGFSELVGAHVDRVRPTLIERVRIVDVAPSAPPSEAVPWSARLASDEAWERRLILLRDVPRLPWLPEQPNGRRISAAQVWSWARHGINGAKLETLQVGQAKRNRCTTQAALFRFFERAANDHPTEAVPKRPAPAHRRTALARANAILEADGI